MKLNVNIGVVISGIIAYVFGGWNLALQTLLLLMVLDYLTGLFVAACGGSTKSKKGKLSPKVAAIGITKKFLILCICGMAYRLDVFMKSEGLLYNVVCLFYIGNEGISILDNMNKSKIKIPKKLRAVLEAILEEDNEG